MVNTQNKRTEERVGAALPVALESTTGITRDVSASGVYFETTDAALAVGQTIDFSVDFDTPGGRRVLKCRGHIVRTDRRDGMLGVAVKIAESMMEAGLLWQPPAAASG